MNDRLYVSTGRDGRSRTFSGEVVWDIPTPGTGPGAPSKGNGSPLELRRLDGLLDQLGERIFVVEATGPSDAPGGIGTVVDGPVLAVGSARIVEETRWDDRMAARFALECAVHAVGGDGDVELPHGRTLESVLEGIRSELDRSGPSADGWLGRLATMAAVRRLRRAGADVNALALAAARDDEATGVELLDDPAWTTMAAIGEAVLASVEALRYLARPGYVAGQEEIVEEKAWSEPSSPVQIEETPWGAVAPGVEHISTYVAAATCAEQAAERSRQAVADREGPEAGLAERAWQVELLERLLSGPGTSA